MENGCDSERRETETVRERGKHENQILLRISIAYILFVEMPSKPIYSEHSPSVVFWKNIDC